MGSEMCIRDRFMGTVEDCHDLCKTTEQCNFFAFRQWNRNVCVLLKTMGNVHQDSNSISGSAYKCRKTGILNFRIFFSTKIKVY